MTAAAGGVPILIAAISARALAASARRAGFMPLAADRFGDADLRFRAADWEPLGGDVADPFAAADCLAALERLASRAPAPPAGVVLGAGFEAVPETAAALACRWPLLGCDARAIARCKEPGLFFPLLDRLGIAYPETRPEPPDDPAGWLVKTVGGAGGAHILPAEQAKAGKGTRHYAQRRVPGRAVSLAALAVGRDLRPIGFSTQWSAPAPGAPFRFGGAAGPLDLPAGIADAILADARKLQAELGLTGLVSFDGLLDGACFRLLEINPRPGATLELFDDAAGSLFAAHVAAARGASGAASRFPSPIAGQSPQSGRNARAPSLSPTSPCALAILYADRGPLLMPVFDWPDWAADRSAPGTLIAPGAPLCTVFAKAHDLDAAIAKVARRAEAISACLYAAARTERTLECPSL